MKPVLTVLLAALVLWFLLLLRAGFDLRELGGVAVLLALTALLLAMA